MPEIDQKKRIEEATARLFLRLYNSRHHSQFEIQLLGEAPDVTCFDRNADKILHLEISLLEDIPGEVPYALGKREKPISPSTGTHAVSLNEDVIPHWSSQIAKKLRASYGKDTALVLRQVSPLWEPYEWEIVAPGFREEVLKGKEANYGAGIWVICSDTSTWPASEALFCLSPPQARR